jgi:hypothetical protein
MSRLTLAATRLLLQDQDLIALLGSNDLGPWVFDQKPLARVENSQSCLVVINEPNDWDAPNSYNNQLFPRLQVDIWADPSRQPNMAVAKWDSDTKIDAVQRIIDSHFHTTNLSVPDTAPAWEGVPGSMRYWGTAAQIADHTGVPILGCQRLGGISTSDIADITGGRMRRISYGVNTF